MESFAPCGSSLIDFGGRELLWSTVPFHFEFFIFAKNKMEKQI